MAGEPNQAVDPAEPRPRLGKRVRVDQFGTVLALLALTIGLSYLTEDSAIRRLAMSGLGGITLVVILLAAGAPRWSIRLAVGALVLITVMVGAALLAGVALDDRGLTPGAAIVVSLVGAAAILRRLASQPVVSVHTALGAVCLYLLAGLMFAQTYLALDQLAGPFFVQLEQADAADTTWFSFVTLATLGYGDLTPRSDLGRMLATFEAVGGQLYLVLIVAVIVANLGRIRQPRGGSDPNLD